MNEFRIWDVWGTNRLSHPGRCWCSGCWHSDRRVRQYHWLNGIWFHVPRILVLSWGWGAETMAQLVEFIQLCFVVLSLVWFSNNIVRRRWAAFGANLLVPVTNVDYPIRIESEQVIVVVSFDVISSMMLAKGIRYSMYVLVNAIIDSDSFCFLNCKRVLYVAGTGASSPSLWSKKEPFSHI